MKNSILPEEKLLKLIRADKKTKLSGLAVSGAMPAKKHNIKSFSINLSHIAFNKSVKFVFFISLFYLIISLVYPVFTSNKIKLPQIEAKERLPAKKEILPQATAIKPYDFYSLGIKGRNIFSSAVLDLGKPIGTASADLIKDINLVGIVSGEEPQAIIEDKKAQKTYYLRKGQFIGQLQLADIQDGKIILSYEGQMYELYL